MELFLPRHARKQILSHDASAWVGHAVHRVRILARVLWFVPVDLLPLPCGHCLWDWTFPHGSRKQQTNVCTNQRNKTILGVSCCIAFTAPPGAHICLNCAYVFTTPRRLQGIVIDCKMKPATMTKDTVQKQIRRCTSYKSPGTFTSGVHLFAALENSLNRRVGVFQCKSSNLPRQRVFPCLSLRFCLTLLPPRRALAYA